MISPMPNVSEGNTTAPGRAPDPLAPRDWQQRRDGVEISIVIPVYNEHECLPHLFQRLADVCTDMSYEVIFVDDGSTDDSLAILLDLARQFQNVRIIEFSRNFGHQMALAAGLDHACGQAVITMDADLQHPPELIGELIARWRQGYDIVYTCRRSTEDAGLLKNLTSRFFYRLINRLTDLQIPEGAADFRLMDRTVVDAFGMLSERSLFLRGLVSWVGYRQTAIYYDAAARQGGQSKYSFLRMLRFAADGITAFSSLPLYLAMVLGAVISALSFLYALFAVYARLVLHRVVEGWTSLSVAVLFLGGVILLTLGIQGVYLGRIYAEVKRRPRYLVRRIYEMDRDS